MIRGKNTNNILNELEPILKKIIARKFDFDGADPELLKENIIEDIEEIKIKTRLEEIKIELLYVGLDDDMDYITLISEESFLINKLSVIVCLQHCDTNCQTCLPSPQLLSRKIL